MKQKEIIIKIKHNLTPFNKQVLETSLVSCLLGIVNFWKGKTTKTLVFEIVGLETDEAKKITKLN